MKTIAFIILSLITTPLAAETKVLAFSGSVREDSYNKKLLDEAAEMARQQGATVNVVNLKDFSMPFFDEDLEKKEGMPSNAKRLRAQMVASDRIIIATPEYNASLSAILKNALDWASRSEDGKPSRDAFKGKKFALLSASQGPGGGARALAHLKAVIENAGGEVVDVQTSIPTAQNAFDAQGKLETPALKAKLKSEIELLLK